MPRGTDDDTPGTVSDRSPQRWPGRQSDDVAAAADHADAARIEAEMDDGEADSAADRWPATTVEALNDYLSTGIHKVNGWCVPQLWQSIWPLALEIGPGPVAEIGVFEGKFLIGLCKTFDAAGRFDAIALDVFDMQEFNLDGAGVGKKDILASNIEAHGLDKGALHCVEVDSLTLRSREAQEFCERYGRVAFFSVDGCHEVVHTVRDIEFAMEVTENNGLIAVDDYTNPNWPGVQEAIARMYLMRSYAFVPLVVTCNKLLLCSLSYHAKYLKVIENYLRAHHETTRFKRVTRFGFPTLTVQPNLQTWTDLAMPD